MPSKTIPTIWAVGDIQGCCNALETLLEHPEIQQDPDAQFWFAGDLINRGPQSLRTLRTIMALGDRAVCVLGNHDLHLLAVYAGIRRENKSDTIDEILQDPDVENIIDWLRHRPLAHYAHQHLMVHAGVMAKWDVKKTLKLAGEISEALRSKNWKKYLQKMYGNEPNRWRDSLTGAKRRRVIVNALTRMRMCFPDGSMEFGSKDAPSSVSKRDNLLPWFELPDRKTEKTTIVFGHWSTLGLMVRKHLIALDTGCVWGGKLSAIRLSDRKLVQIECMGNKK
ncbi:symmetrical bis(5'-nucleosyl)-tetraphosphatase [Pelistega europaea]|uniref:Bis(5'-nucleosyl)-tetraphosphatase, symmetrical n=1 Tax=Pelistega europaea TaxID=106147 RepID=A0A7Y4LCZ6_9BURK|nr:symmetrical bis(5'-nucleosyl)-tetraphosphatase [Pelistega europaea]NOL49961.1 symmetrical bis(5'-nucleosyl)-tetraphosphatase [Pelistega europaea]